MPLGKIIDTNEGELTDHPHESFKGVSGMTLVGGEDGEGYSLHYVEIAPGGVIESHAHRERSEGVFLLSGRARLQIGQQAVEAGAGYFGWGPENVILEIENTGDDPVSLLATFAPSFRDHDPDHDDRILPENRFEAPVTPPEE